MSESGKVIKYNDFSRDVSQYKKASEVFKFLSNKVKRYCPKDGIVLEIGFGCGDLMRMIRDNNINVFGIELDDVAIEANRDLDVCNMDARELPPLHKYSVIVMVFILEMVDLETSKQIIAGALGGLKPGGRIVIVEKLNSPKEAQSISMQSAKDIMSGCDVVNVRSMSFHSVGERLHHVIRHKILSAIGIIPHTHIYIEGYK